MMSRIVRSVSRFLYPFIFLYGIYIAVHGHLTPGGGFPAGVIMASSMLLLVLAYGIKETHALLNITEAIKDTTLVAILGVFIFTILLTHVMPRLELFSGGVTTLFSGGPIPIFNVASGLEVALAFVIVALVMLRIGDK